MNTDFHLAAVVPADAATKLEGIFQQADDAARLVEARMNHYSPDSELSRFNAAPAGTKAPLSAPTVKVLAMSRRLYDQTGGAFDVTALPLIDLWKNWKDAEHPPSVAAVAAARGRSRWDYIELSDDGASKSAAGACFDLGGIAKGYAIDLAAERMIAGGCAGGIVNIGGDVRCFGSRPGGQPWRVAVVDPFHPDGEPLMVLAVRDAAVCTSGNYRRFVAVKGRRFSHIVDPRSGMPTEAACSVTVIAAEAATADGWATALSVLGPAGLRLLRGTGIDAMMVTGEKDRVRYHRTPGFDRHVVQSRSGWPTTAGDRG